MRALLGKLICAVGWVLGLLCVLAGAAVIFIAGCCVMCLAVGVITSYILCRIGVVIRGKRESVE